MKFDYEKIYDAHSDLSPFAQRRTFMPYYVWPIFDITIIVLIFLATQNSNMQLVNKYGIANIVSFSISDDDNTMNAAFFFIFLFTAIGIRSFFVLMLCLMFRSLRWKWFWIYALTTFFTIFIPTIMGLFLGIVVFKSIRYVRN